MGVGSDTHIGGGKPGEPSEFLRALVGRESDISKAGGCPPETVFE
jgi:hypothetical protein